MIPAPFSHPSPLPLHCHTQTSQQNIQLRVLISTIIKEDEQLLTCSCLLLQMVAAAAEVPGPQVQAVLLPAVLLPGGPMGWSLQSTRFRATHLGAVQQYVFYRGSSAKFGPFPKDFRLFSPVVAFPIEKLALRCLFRDFS